MKITREVDLHNYWARDNIRRSHQTVCTGCKAIISKYWAAPEYRGEMGTKCGPCNNKIKKGGL